MGRLRADAKSPALGIDDVRPATNLRKGLELAALTAAIGGLLYSSIKAMDPPVQAGPSPAERTLEAIIDQEVATTNATAPFKIDNVTTLVSARREGRIMIVDYDLTIADDVSRQSLEASVHSNVVAQGCAEARVRELLGVGASVRYRYRLLKGDAPMVVDLTPGTCGPSNADPAVTPSPQNNSSISR